MGKGNNDPSITIGYKYRMDMHLALCLGPVDAIKEFRTPEVSIWKGNAKQSGTIAIDKPDVFGGKFKQGGVVGNVELMMGDSNQIINSDLRAAILKSLPTALVPEYRGVTTLFWNNLHYQSNTARPKPWTVRATRIPFKNQTGSWLAVLSKNYGTIHSLDIPNEAPQLSSASISEIARQIYREVKSKDTSSSASDKPTSTDVGSSTNLTGENNLKRITDKAGVYDVLDGTNVSLKTVVDSKGNLLDGTQIVFGSITYTRANNVFKDTAGTTFAYDVETLIHYIGDFSVPISGAKYQSPSNALDGYGVRLYRMNEIAPVIPSDLPLDNGVTKIVTTIESGSNYLGNTAANNASKSDLADWLTALGGSPNISIEDRLLNFSKDMKSLTWGGISYEMRETKFFNGSTFKMYYMVNSIANIFPFEVSDRVVAAGVTTADILRSKGSIQDFTYSRMVVTQTATLESGAKTQVTASSDIVAAEIIRQEDANPALIIAECLTSTVFSLGYPIDKLDEYSFTVTAEKLYKEGFGLSATWENSSPVEEFLKLVLQTINAVLYVDPSTAKFVLKLLRPDFNYADPSGSFKVKIADGTNIVEVRKFTRSAMSETVNQVTVQWTGSTNGKLKSLTVNNPASISMSEGIVAVSRDYPMIISDYIARLVAERDLSILSQPLSAVELVVNRDFWNIAIGDVITWNWPEYGIIGMPLRISSVAYGLKDNGQITLTCIEDIFREYETQYVIPTGDNWSTPVAPPLPSTYVEVKELNLFEFNLVKSASRFGLLENDLDTTTGLVAVFASRPNVTSVDFAVNWGEAEVSGLSFTPWATLSAPIGRESANIIQLQTADEFELISSDSYAYCDKEIFQIVDISHEKLQISVNRGMLGTVPLSHPAGSVIWFYSDNLSRCVITTSFIENSTHTFKVLPRNALNDYLSLSAATGASHTITSDWDRPPAPGWLRIKNKFLNTDIQGV